MTWLDSALATDQNSTGLSYPVPGLPPPALTPSQYSPVRTHLPELLKILLHVLHRGVY